MDGTSFGLFIFYTNKRLWTWECEKTNICKFKRKREEFETLEVDVLTDKHSCCCKLLFGFLSFVAVILILPLVVAAPFLGYCRDYFYINGNNNSVCNTWVIVPNINDLTCDWSPERGAIITTHAFLIAFVLFAEFVVRVLFVMIFLTSIKKWKEGIINQNWECVVESDQTDVIVNEKYFCLYNKYIEIGTKSQVERDTFKAWFFIEYLSFFIAIIIEIVHVLKTDKIFIDVIHSCLFIIFEFMAFSVLFLMANWLNSVHEKYYQNMLLEYYKYPVVKNKYYIPGNRTCNVVGGKEEFSYIASDENYKEEYKEYYIKLMAKKLPKRIDFDFVPSLCNITIPLVSSGYTFTMLLTFVAIIFNFTSL